MQLAPRTIARVRAVHPSVRIEFLEASTPVQIRRLRAGRLDLAILAAGTGLPDYDLTGVELEPLPSGRLMLAVGRRHRLAGADRATVADLADEGWIVGRGPAVSRSSGPGRRSRDAPGSSPSSATGPPGSVSSPPDSG